MKRILKLRSTKGEVFDLIQLAQVRTNMGILRTWDYTLGFYKSRRIS